MDIRPLIEQRLFNAALRPVVSVRQKDVRGHKAHMSAPAPFSTTAELRDAAAREGLSVELDRALRAEALSLFRSLPPAPGQLLFLRFETALVDQGVVGSGHLLSQVKTAGLSPENVVIEISESGARDKDALKSFLDTYRSHGFLIALSDVGAGHSNLSRVALARPDILTIGGSLVRNIDTDAAKREIFRALLGLSHKIGALVVATDVDRREEALSVLDVGVDMVEGAVWGDTPDNDSLRKKIDDLAAAFKTYSVDARKAQATRAREQDRMLGSLLKELVVATPEDMDARLKTLAQTHPDIECLFVLDENGIQITDTVWGPSHAIRPNGLFRPAKRGADHSLKDYFFLLQDTFVNRARTEPYISQASGTLCVTSSGLFRNAKNQLCALCMDLPA